MVLAALAVFLIPFAGAQEPPRTGLPVELVGAAVDAARPSRSVAFFVCPGAPGASHNATASPGERACDVLEVREVRPRSAVVLNLSSGRLELIEMQEVAVTTSQPSPSPPFMPAPPAERAPYVVSSTASEIAVEIPRADFEHLLANLPEVLTSARAVPFYRVDVGGEQRIQGFTMTEVRPSGAIARLGLRDGDVVLSFNGEPMDSVQAVMRLVTEVPSMTRGTMTVLRDTRRVTFNIAVK